MRPVLSSAHPVQRPASAALLLALGAMLCATALPVSACERHLHGHDTGSDTTREQMDGR